MLQNFQGTYLAVRGTGTASSLWILNSFLFALILLAKLNAAASIVVPPDARELLAEILRASQAPETAPFSPNPEVIVAFRSAIESCCTALEIPNIVFCPTEHHPDPLVDVQRDLPGLGFMQLNLTPEKNLQLIVYLHALAQQELPDSFIWSKLRRLLSPPSHEAIALNRHFLDMLDACEKSFSRLNVVSALIGGACLILILTVKPDTLLKELAYLWNMYTGFFTIGMVVVVGLILFLVYRYCNLAYTKWSAHRNSPVRSYEAYLDIWEINQALEADRPELIRFILTQLEHEDRSHCWAAPRKIVHERIEQMKQLLALATNAPTVLALPELPV